MSRVLKVRLYKGNSPTSRSDPPLHQFASSASKRLIAVPYARPRGACRPSLNFPRAQGRPRPSSGCSQRTIASMPMPCSTSSVPVPPSNGSRWRECHRRRSAPMAELEAGPARWQADSVTAGTRGVAGFPVPTIRVRYKLNCREFVFCSHLGSSCGRVGA
jgi:hypothetical protein